MDAVLIRHRFDWEPTSVANDLRQALTAVLPRLYRFGMALTGSSADTDDLVQNTCERVLRRSDQLREINRLDAWLFGIMRNIWIDEIRHRRVRRHDQIDAASDVIGEDGQANVDGRMNLAAVRRAMTALPVEQRTVLMLVCVDGLSYKEAAEVLDIPVGTIMSRLSRARQNLHDRMSGRPVADSVTQLPLRQPGGPPLQGKVRPG
jgi:RNA polymerase sigma-70 factor (ECF subfamily)